MTNQQPHARFLARTIGTAHVEYDQDTRSLRLSWCGGQTFFRQEEARHLFMFLAGVFPDLVTPLLIGDQINTNLNHSSVKTGERGGATWSRSSVRNPCS